MKSTTTDDKEDNVIESLTTVAPEIVDAVDEEESGDVDESLAFNRKTVSIIEDGSGEMIQNVVITTTQTTPAVIEPK